MIGNFLFLSAEYFFLSSQELLSNSLHYLDIKKLLSGHQEIIIRTSRNYYLDIKKLLSEHHNKLESIISLFQAS